jgi:hypothetical protein
MAISEQGQDPAAEPPVPEQGPEGAARKSGWGGDRRSGTGEVEYNERATKAKDLHADVHHDIADWGKREFKGGSPLATSKGGTILASDGVEKTTLDGKNSLLDSLKKQFNNLNKSILSEDSIIDDADEDK